MRTFKLFKRWVKMLSGKSSFHVKQGCGKFYSKKEVRGYYNDLTNKVSKETILDNNGIPINTTISNLKVYFPISIFQYGLGLYDLYLETGNDEYKVNFLNIVEWAINNIENNGMWNCMSSLNDRCHLTQSSMCQSEGASLLFRAYVLTQEKKYLDCGIKAIDFMLLDIKDGGTAEYSNEGLVFQEYVSDANLSVLNGWIFSIFGLYDCTLMSDKKKYKVALSKTIDTLVKSLEKYDRGFWSNYDLKGTISSPAYHDLHIMQLDLLYDLFKKNEFNIFSKKWKKYQLKRGNKYLAMLIKLKQKIKKSKYYDINTSLVK